MADGSLIFDTKLDSSGLNSGLSSIGGLATGAMKAIGVGVSVAAGAVAALTKSSVQSYAAYEQLVGGVDTLFKDSSTKVQEYANQAYRTAGMSANTYMETVTGFSASLLQSLGGDTAAATEYANQAVIDMSDNANKMGTDIESIQNAYQGFAKQNYTMLDNLKLGYGGTKEEMQRLLEDASKISGIEYDISSFSDITEAIHVMQTEMGISGITAEEAAQAVADGTMTEEEAFNALGTTAKEASTTIEGSLNSAKAAWENLLTGLADGDADLETLIDNFVQSVTTAGENILPVVEQSIIGISSLIEQLFPQIASMLPGLIQQVLPGLLSAGADVIIALVTGIVNALPQLVPAVSQIVMQLVNGLLPLLPQIVQIGCDIIVQLALGIAQALPDLIPTIVDVVMQIVEVLIDNADALTDASITLIMALADGLINALPVLLDKAPGIISKLVVAILKSNVKMFNAGIELLLKLLAGIVESIPKLIKSISKLGTDMVDEVLKFVKDFTGCGDNLIDGLWAGIKSKWTNLTNNVSSLCQQLIDKVKKMFDIHSPSKKFAWIGQMCVEGFDQGFDDFDPNAKFNETVKASKNVLLMDYNAGIEAEYELYGTDYDKLGDSVVGAFVRSGVTIEVDKRVFGRIMRSYT